MRSQLHVPTVAEFFHARKCFRYLPLCHFPAWITKLRPETANGCGNVKRFSKQLERQKLPVGELLGFVWKDHGNLLTSMYFVWQCLHLLSQRKFHRASKCKCGRVNRNVSDQLGALELLHQHAGFPCGLCGHLHPEELKLKHAHVGTMSPALVLQQ